MNLRPKGVGIPTGLMRGAASRSWLAAGLLAAVTVGYSATEAEASPPGEAVAAAVVVQERDTTFRHDRHEGFECLECHSMQSAHGARLVQDVSDCRSCHHTEERVDQECAACHVSSAMLEVVYSLQRTLSLSVHDLPTDRAFRFGHLDHAERECAECHVAGPSYAVPDLDCQGCHEDHHAEAVSQCLSCHVEPPDDAHDPSVHQTCSGSGCHVDSPIKTPPRSRIGCLWCHQEQVEHEPDGDCVDCHAMAPSQFASGTR